MEDFFEPFRFNIKFYRSERNISQRELSIQADCTDGMIGQIEAGRTKPSFDMIVKLANALKVHPADLFLRDASKSQEKVSELLSELCSQDIPEIIEKKFSISLKN
ncbi:MAG: helix-turn-helix transcriptional regulator [Treponema sp.]|uniref:helix-turn-helix domain-containing protein n=1 Tax=Treponema sp. TaxID=166 RepID=UPI002A6863BB|nr:helix-turn-helix transcriptional regulator [Treponema sp.]MCI6441663.1 helix-turn-helix domain-containing protein [Spirochaetia bacterium]MDD7450408.1 helix-turn-helix transcriptional regulator [Treponema sp.]MDY4133145.1 helix-turn-helix transcriptional regulator [Treponema sp.]